VLEIKKEQMMERLPLRCLQELKESAASRKHWMTGRIGSIHQVASQFLRKSMADETSSPVTTRNLQRSSAQDMKVLKHFEHLHSLEPIAEGRRSDSKDSAKIFKTMQPAAQSKTRSLKSIQTIPS